MAASQKKFKVFTPGEKVSKRRLFSGIPSTMYRDVIVQSPEKVPVRTTNTSKLSMANIMGNRTKSSALFHDPSLSRDVCFNDLVKEPTTLEKKNQTFSKMVGRDQISSVRKGQFVNKILMATPSDKPTKSLKNLRLTMQLQKFL